MIFKLGWRMTVLTVSKGLPHSSEWNSCIGQPCAIAWCITTGETIGMKCAIAWCITTGETVGMKVTCITNVVLPNKHLTPITHTERNHNLLITYITYYGTWELQQLIILLANWLLRVEVWIGTYDTWELVCYCNYNPLTPTYHTCIL